jgi:hypothetical protein
MSIRIRKFDLENGKRGRGIREGDKSSFKVNTKFGGANSLTPRSTPRLLSQLRLTGAAFVV